MKYFYILFILTWVYIPFQAQNSCSNPFEISNLGTFTIDVIDGDPQSEICIPGQNAQTHAEWYRFTPSTSFSLQISSDLEENTGGDTRFSIFTGDCNSLVCIGGNDDDGEGYLSKLTLDVTANTTYYIVWDNRWSSDGFNFELSNNEPVTDLSFTNSNINNIGTYDKGCVDMNGDFLDDIISFDYINNTRALRLHVQNTDGSFSVEDYPVNGLLNLPSWSLAAGDYNADGINDLVLGGGNAVSFLVSESGGFVPINYTNYVFSQRSNFIDINNDGHLDSFVCHDVQPNVYFMNDGNHNLSFNQGGLGDTPNGGNYGSIWTDYDNDGDMDLFIAKCRGGDTTASLDQLHRNNGDGTFTNVAESANLEDAIQSWSSAWGDFDNDGDMDVLVAANSFGNGGHKLMANNGDGTFSNITVGSNWENIIYSSREMVTHDFNNDGFLDLFGSMLGGKIYINNGDMTFSPIDNSPSFGSVADLNNDGFLDVYSSGIIYSNDTNDNHWVSFRLNGVASNKNGIGARIEIFGDWGKQIREVRSGDGFGYMSTLNVHFGLGNSSAISTVVVKWPSGVVDTYSNIPIDNTMVITEGETLAVEDVQNTHYALSLSPNPTQDILYLESPEPIQSCKLYNLQGEWLMSSTEHQLNVQHLSSGLYLIEVLWENGHKTSRKFLKD